MDKINIPNAFNWIPIFNEMATGCDSSLPINKVDDYRFVLTACFEDDRRSRARTISYRWNVVGTPENVVGIISGWNVVGIISQKLVQWLNEGRITFNKVSEIVRCSQKALQLFAHSG